MTAENEQLNPDWDGRMKAEAQKLKVHPRREGVPSWSAQNWPPRRVRILRIALEAIYGTPELTLAEARALAHRALEDTE